MRKIRFPLVIILSLACSSLAAEQTQTIVSPPHRVALLELYTSEGCNSCPPAEEWVGQLEKKGLGADKVIPIALHVDYWDYLGWRDIYADPRHSQRQRQHVLRNKLATAYTPQLILNGKDLRPSRLLESRLKKINATTATVEIHLAATQTESNDVTVKARIKRNGNTATGSNLYLALVADKITSRIKAGENAGRRLVHHYVVRKLLGPIALPGDEPFSVHQKSFSLRKAVAPSGLAIVAFVEDSRGSILQSIRLHLR